jgi:hypothetical protein
MHFTHDIDSDEVLAGTWSDQVSSFRRVKSLPAIRPATQSKANPKNKSC